ncbi:helix-turn-helix domain-containing protein [Cyclobacterium qasimii]|uniref:Helix-turn-helix-domain containing protein, AraC type n=2 Tax=Cyclobacterium qasimii TaxID=1350429 RepID=S7X685_9BACT|nr:AraC family transcriptional regulator [Cyclobacterium qasimii]EPR71573.1 helix-turn-helix- domain containing protein, AraC type [Cyclobacterium qasimii M12-11B]GEO20279.1 AraC family transcriptional regulator [Cyclobacterium qasimii]
MNQVILWKDMILFWGSNEKAISEHRHPTIQLVLATDNSFTSQNGKGEWIEKKGLLIAPNYSHKCNAKNIPILTLDIDPESILGEWIAKHLLNGKKSIDFTPKSIDFKAIAELLAQQKWEDLRTIVEGVFLFRNEYESALKDNRIETVIDFIVHNINEPLTSKNLSQVACLSESRLLHLFKEKMGLPIRNYILWIRIKMVIMEITKGNSLTKASFEAGFSDQAHMTRTFIKVIGLPPSTFSKNSKFVQVFIP